MNSITPMSKFTFILFLSFMFSQCQQEDITNIKDRNDITETRGGLTPSQILARQWTMWVFGRDPALSPTEPDETLMQLDQPNASGTMMIMPGSSPDYFEKSLTLNYNQYQSVFVPIAAGFNWNNSCYDITPNGNIQNGLINVKEFANGKENIIVKLDGVLITPSKLKNLRVDAGYWIDNIHPDWDGGCIASETKFHADGYFIKVPLTRGNHTLYVKGGFVSHRYKFDFLNEFTYHFQVN
jgi:hypothetical protein